LIKDRNLAKYIRILGTILEGILSQSSKILISKILIKISISKLDLTEEHPTLIISSQEVVGSKLHCWKMKKEISKGNSIVTRME